MIRLMRGWTLQALLSGAVVTNELELVASYADEFPDRDGQLRTFLRAGRTSGTTPVTLVEAPVGPALREIDKIAVRNSDTLSATIIIRISDGASTAIVSRVTLSSLDTLVYAKGAGWYVTDTSGNLRQDVSSVVIDWASPGAIGSTTANTGRFTTVESTVATGTAPLIIASTTQVNNLNADLLDGQHGSYYRDASNLNAGTVPYARLTIREGWKNKIINGCARIQNGEAKTISTSNQIGLSDRVNVKVSSGSTSAGSVTASTISGYGKAHAVTGLTTTGSGVVDWTTRLPGADVAQLSGKQVTVSAVVEHDVGSAINYTIVIRKPTTTEDTFSAVTTLSTSSASSVSNATATRISHTYTLGSSEADLGLEIVVQAAMGAVTTKAFKVAQWQLEEGANVTEFERRPASLEALLCYPYRPVLIESAGRYGTGHAFTTAAALIDACFHVPARVAPTGIETSASGTFQLWDGAGGLVGCNAAPTLYSASKNGATLSCSVAAGLTVGRGSGLVANGSGYIRFTGCEL